VLSPWAERWDPHGQKHKQTKSLQTGVISMDREMRSRRTEIETEEISSDRCYLHGHRDGIPTDRNTKRQSPRTEGVNSTGKEVFFSVEANA
jgi:hypothetical protein